MQRRDPGRIEKLKQTFRVARHFYRQGMLPWQTKKAPFLWPSWRQGVPQWHLVDLYSYVNEGFNANAVIYSAVLYKGRAMTAAPLRAYKGDRDEREQLPEEHPMSKLLARPNPFQSFSEFQMLNVGYLDIAGNCYIYMDRPRQDALPTAMYPLRPDRVWVVPDRSGGLAGFIYVPEGKTKTSAKPILPQDMMHVKWPNLMDPLEGMGEGLSPVSPMAKSADIHNLVTDFVHTFFQRGTLPRVALTFEDPMDDDDMARVRDIWVELYGGVENAIEPAVLDQGAKVDRIGLTFDEMGFDSVDERTESLILGPLGVPAVLLGMRTGLKHATYSNVEELRRMCWEDTLIPENRLFETEFQYYLRGERGEFVMYDYSKVPALQKDIPALTEAYSKLVMYGVPPNLAAETVGLPIEEIPGGDVSYMPFSMMPMQQERQPTMLPAGGGASATEEQREEGKAAWSQERKDLICKSVDKIAESWEAQFGDMAVRVFDKERRKLLALLNEAKTKAQEDKATINWEAIYKAWMEYLDEAGEEWRQAFIPLIKGVITDQAKHLSLAYGITFDVANLWAEASFAEYTFTFADEIMDTTKSDIAELLRLATHEGWSIPKMSKHLEQLFAKWMQDEPLPDEFRKWFEKRMPRYRREAIARTETMKASNFGNYEVQRAWGVPKSQWWSTLDDRVRDTHRAAHGQIVDIGQPFKVGGYELMYPGDSSRGAPAEEIIQCRCTTLPWKPEWGEFEAAQRVGQ